MSLIYLDNNSTTPVLPAVWEAMQPYFGEIFGNPASAHAAGRRARQALENARERVAELLGAFPDEVIFTSGATEANNLAILGLAGEPPGQIVTSPVEHPSVAEPVAHLARRGFAVAYLPVADEGIVPTTGGSETIRHDARLVSVLRANHETGAIQPVADIAAQFTGAAFHCDAVQAVGKIPVQFHELGVTSLSVSAHKFYGPKGIGALLVRRGTRLAAVARGGHQQGGRRPGTEPVALAVGLARALELACAEMEARLARILHLRRIFLEALSASREPFVINGPADVGARGLPHTMNISFPGCRADLLLMNLDLAGVACSTGSACSSGSLLPSPVLQAMGVPADLLHSAMRFSLSHLLSESDVAEAAQRVAAVVCRLRGAGD